MDKESRDGNLAIQVYYNDDDTRLLMAHWRLVDLEERRGNVMFCVEARCGCTANLDAFRPCDRHSGAREFRVIDPTSPSGRRNPIR